MKLKNAIHRVTTYVAEVTVMKRRHIYLGSSALLAATAITFFSFTHAPQVTAYVKVKYQGSSTFTCVNTGFTCSATGPVFCKVSVKIDVPPGTKTVRAHHDNTCDVFVLHTSNTPVGTYDPAQVIIDAQD